MWKEKRKEEEEEKTMKKQKRFKKWINKCKLCPVKKSKREKFFLLICHKVINS